MKRINQKMLFSLPCSHFFIDFLTGLKSWDKTIFFDKVILRILFQLNCDIFQDFNKIIELFLSFYFRHWKFLLKISPKKIVIENFFWKFRQKKSSLKNSFENFAKKIVIEKFFFSPKRIVIGIFYWKFRQKKSSLLI